jgi:hypothetical protein
MRTVRLRSDDRMPKAWTDMRVVFVDGRTDSASADAGLSWSNAAMLDRVVRKFKTLVSPVAPSVDIDALLHHIANLDQCPDLSVITDVLTVPRPILLSPRS